MNKIGVASVFMLILCLISFRCGFYIGVIMENPESFLLNFRGFVFTVSDDGLFEDLEFLADLCEGGNCPVELFL